MVDIAAGRRDHANDRSDRLVAPPFDGASAGGARRGDGISSVAWKRAGHRAHRNVRLARGHLSQRSFAGLVVPDLRLIGRSADGVPGTSRREHELRIRTRVA